MARRLVGDRKIVLALHERREAGKLLALSRQSAGIVAGGATDVIGSRFDPAFADRNRTNEIHREASQMRKSVVAPRAFDRSRDQRGWRPCVLMFRMPRAARERARLKEIVAKRDISCVQSQTLAHPFAPRVHLGLRCGEAGRKTVAAAKADPRSA